METHWQGNSTGHPGATHTGTHTHLAHAQTHVSTHTCSPLHSHTVPRSPHTHSTLTCTLTAHSQHAHCTLMARSLHTHNALMHPHPRPLNAHCTLTALSPHSHVHTHLTLTAHSWRAPRAGRPWRSAWPACSGPPHHPVRRPVCPTCPPSPRPRWPRPAHSGVRYQLGWGHWGWEGPPGRPEPWNALTAAPPNPCTVAEARW